MENTEKNKIADEMISVGKSLVKILSDALNGRQSEFDDSLDYKKLYILADKHRVSAIAAKSVVGIEEVPAEIKRLFETQLFKTAARYTAQSAENREISQKFTESGISHCFLKGAKVAAFYDEPELRFMLDSDIYVNSEKADSADKIMLERGYKKTASDDKDSGYEKAPFFLVEIHRELKYDYDIGCEYFKNAYKNLIPSENGGLEVTMTNEDFYVYILSHTAHHFSVSGTGFRSVIDHWYLCKKLKPICDDKLLAEKLAESGLSVFNKKMTALTDCLFDGKEGDSLTEAMTDYIILSGVFGNETNGYINGVLKRGLEDKKKSYFRSRLFPKIDFMKINYPILTKLPFLLPVCWVLRILKTLFSGKKIKSEIDAVNGTTESDIALRESFFNDVGI